jgi:purine-nucleoside phosphorylase
LTPHIEASKGDYAETVLLPGDPDRARWIAETFFERPRCVNRVRGCLGYSGSYRGVPVSVQATGIGRPSIAIYIHELVQSYGAKTLIRTGTCGALDEAVGLRSLYLAETAIMDFDIASGRPPMHPDAALLRLARLAAGKSGVAHHVGPQVSSDVFYHPDPLGRFDAARALGARAVDMETAELFALSARLGFRALSVCTVVDSLATGEATALSERQALFADMAKLALDVACAGD